MWIDLRSDTVTKPSKGMRQAMLMAEVGDDVFGEDPSVNALEQYIAEMFEKEAALFVPSGTMANQIAIKLHTQPMEEVIAEENAHIFYYENGGFAFHSGISIRLARGNHGKISVDDIAPLIREKADWLPETTLVSIENTTNRGGGHFYTASEVKKIYAFCQSKNLKLHTDGARIFNAIVAGGGSPVEYGRNTDTISICFSKGLGAPVGSALLGTKKDIQKARKIRKAMGGGMRQAGLLAFGAMFSLRHHVERLRDDHENAQKIVKALERQDYIKSVVPVKTNIIIADLADNKTLQKFIELMKQNHILVVPFGERTVRMVTHKDVHPDMIEQTIEILIQLNKEL